MISALLATFMLGFLVGLGTALLIVVLLLDRSAGDLQDVNTPRRR